MVQVSWLWHPETAERSHTFEGSILACRGFGLGLGLGHLASQFLSARPVFLKPEPEVPEPEELIKAWMPQRKQIRNDQSRLMEASLLEAYSRIFCGLGDAGRSSGLAGFEPKI